MATRTALVLSDDVARREAVAVRDRSFLVEAGAGSGKTAVLAGRIAMLLAGGVAPNSIAAVTFTEFAASELLIRVRAFVSALAAEDIPVELNSALPDGLSEEQRGNLAQADATLDEMTCSTIHGFCQRLIAPYPVEADIDPGASVMDRDQAELAFVEIVDSWLREELAGEEGGLLAELVLHDPHATIALIRTILEHLRRHREFAPYELQDLDLLAAGFREAVDDFATFLDEAEAKESETVAITGQFQELAGEVAAALPADTPAALVALLVMAPHPDLLTGSGSFRKYQKKGKWGSRRKARRSGQGRCGAAERRGERSIRPLLRGLVGFAAGRRHLCARRSRAAGRARYGPFPRAQARRRAARLRRPDILGARSPARPRRGAPRSGRALPPRPRRRVPGHRPASD